MENREELKERLMDGARRGGICAEGYGQMRSRDRDGLIDYYIGNPDWCMERSFPALETLREEFGDLGERGIFVDRQFRGELLNGRQAYIFHHCRGTIKVGLNVEESLIPMLYVGNGCQLRIVGTGERVPDRETGRVEVPIYSFGQNDISARDNRYVRFIHYKHKLL